MACHCWKRRSHLPPDAVCRAVGVVMTGDVARADVVTTTVDPYADRDDAVDALFRRHCADLIRLEYCLLGDRGAAEEVVQDAFLALHRQWWRLRAHTSAVPYLRAAVVNGCRSRQRRMVPACALAAAVWKLPPRLREVPVCRFYLEMSAAQTADRYGRTGRYRHAECRTGCSAGHR